MTDAPALKSRPLHRARVNPFASAPDTNPLMIADSLTLVPVPSPVETHEPRSARRSYMAAGGGGGGGLDLSELFKGMRRKPVQHERAAADDDDDVNEPAEPVARSSGPPRYGRR
jgi:hypothetical protein